METTGPAETHFLAVDAAVAGGDMASVGTASVAAAAAVAYAAAVARVGVEVVVVVGVAGWGRRTSFLEELGVIVCFGGILG